VVDTFCMGTNAHPRLHARSCGLTEPLVVRVLVYARQAPRASWVESELQHRSVMVQLAFSVAQLVSALVEDPPPRPQILVADFDDMNAGELLHLQVLREQGWFGRIIALGDVPPEMCISLGIERVIGAPFPRDALRGVIAESPVGPQPTTRIPAL
jgi:hypothetical protein